MSSVKQEVLTTVISGVGGFFGPRMKRAGVNQAVTPIGYEKLGTRGHEVNADEGGNVKLSCQIGDEFEELIAQFLKVVIPFRAGKHSWLRPGVFHCFGDSFCFNSCEYLL